VLQNSLIAMALHGNVTMQSRIFHGAEPAGAYHTITKTDSNTVLEIDGRGALEVIDELWAPKGTRIHGKNMRSS
jgi:hypothetical protein